MNCEQRRNTILQYVASDLDETERRELCAHLDSGCPTCADHLAEAEELQATLMLTLDLKPVPEGARGKLLSGLGERRVERLKVPPVRRSSAHRILSAVRRQAAVWLIVASTLFATVAFGAVYVTLSHRIERQTFELNNLLLKVMRRDDRIKQLETDLAEAKASAASSVGRLQIIALERREPQPNSAGGSAFWDQRNRQCMLFVNGLRPAGQQRTYQVWLSGTEREPIPAATFDVDSKGDAWLRFSLPFWGDDLSIVAVTNEPSGGSEQPTGTYELFGQINEVP